MNAITATGADGFLARYEAMKGRLPGDSTLRAAAAEAFRALGLPGAARGRPMEAWKYTSLRPLAGMSFAGFDATQDTAPADRPVAGTLLFQAGRFRADLSAVPDGMFACFADAPDFGELSWPDRDPAAALNTMLAEDGAIITIPDGHDAGVRHLVHRGVAGTSAHPRHLIRLAPGARLTLIETCDGDGGYLLNPVMEIHIGRDAKLTHVRVQRDAAQAIHLAVFYAAVAAGGTYDHFTLNLGARIARTEIHASLDGPGATAHLNGAQCVDGARLADFTTVVRHAAPKGTSRQTVKNVLNGRARGVFQGRIEVARGADGTDGYQMNRALLLSPDAEIDSKPELEIFADDVKCSHGATVGELDADQLFYLRSRGVPDREARAILMRAFLDDALTPVVEETARALLDQAIAAWWGRQAA